ncbi:ASPRV1 [Cordylochernes scorpioides]|uniref:ASPRV1 n=1 Tax=Cordylochernes scorpioides TaxID=51811 RepID=A0ABY6LN41_9ARAC|nr:ASPRV1 [Cordylochernes scorpioides]
MEVLRQSQLSMTNQQPITFKHDQLIANQKQARRMISTNEKSRELMTRISDKKLGEKVGKVSYVPTSIFIPADKMAVKYIGESGKLRLPRAGREVFSIFKKPVVTRIKEYQGVKFVINPGDSRVILQFSPEEDRHVTRPIPGLISTLQLVKKLDRYPFRKKRKFDSVEQEETTMNIKKEATNQYERVAKHNQWDESLCLANVYFYLNSTALKWFENNEESILTWKEFMSQLKSVFGKNENLRLRAEKTLKTRAQLKGESTEFYIQDVLRLCKEVDPHMNEEDKISHLMKGIAEELYQALLPRDAHTTEQFVTECRRIEALHCKRVTPTRYERLPNVASLSDHDEWADLSSMIRQMVREEVQRALASPREEPEISAIEHMVQQEIEKTIAPISRSFPQNRAPRPLPSPRYEFQPRNFQPRPQQPKQVNGRRDTNEWRTTEGKPICFHCGRPGHVVRYCRDRRREYEGEQTWNYKQRDKQEPRTFYNSRSSQEPNDDLPRENIHRYRSPSPYTGRKGQHSSPERRPSQSPRRSRQEN